MNLFLVGLVRVKNTVRNWVMCVLWGPSGSEHANWVAMVFGVSELQALNGVLMNHDLFTNVLEKASLSKSGSLEIMF